jgi:hypothetical protein
LDISGVREDYIMGNFMFYTLLLEWLNQGALVEMCMYRIAVGKSLEKWPLVRPNGSGLW